MKYFLLTLCAFICIPVSIVALLTSLNNNSNLSRLEVIVARQHDINPEKMKKNGERSPFVSRTIKIIDVKFDEQNKAYVSFYDTNVKKSYEQIGCASVIKHIGKSFIVDYNTVKNSYAIKCNKFKI